MSSQSISERSPNTGHSREALVFLLTAAIALSLLYVVAQTFQGPSIIWSVRDADQLEIRVLRFPFETASRTYKLSVIVGVGTTETEDGGRMLVFDYGNLSLQIPWQNNRVISKFDAYARSLNYLVKEARSGHPVVELRHYHRGYSLAIAALIAAVLTWCLFFSTALIGGRTRVP